MAFAQCRPRGEEKQVNQLMQQLTFFLHHILNQNRINTKKQITKVLETSSSARLQGNIDGDG